MKSKSKISKATTKSQKKQKKQVIAKQSRTALKKQADIDIAAIRKGLVRDDYAYLDDDSVHEEEIQSDLPIDEYLGENGYDPNLDDEGA